MEGELWLGWGFDNFHNYDPPLETLLFWKYLKMNTIHPQEENECSSYISIVPFLFVFSTIPGNQKLIADRKQKN